MDRTSAKGDHMNASGLQRQLYSRRETAELLGICVRSIDAWIADGRLNSVKLGRRRLIHRETLLNFAGSALRERM
jgi:excisionase family DNA binding protein